MTLMHAFSGRRAVNQN